MSTSWPQAARWLEALGTQQRQSPHTLSAYRRDIDKLATLAQGASAESLGPADIRRFLARLHGEGLGPRSLARTLCAWRGFYRWLSLQKQVATNPCEGIRPPKAPQRLPKTLSVDEAGKLLDGAAAPEQDDPEASRDRAMFELLYSSGLRLAELVGLDREAAELMLHDGEVRVTGKREKTRIVPVGSKAQAALSDWLTQRALLAAPEENALFVGKRGQRISPRVVEARLARLAQAAGLAVHVHPHMLRHAFASHVLQSSGDLRAVQEMLGHASIASTQVYTHLDFQHLAQVYDQAHPRAKRRSG